MFDIFEYRDRHEQLMELSDDEKESLVKQENARLKNVLLL